MSMCTQGRERKITFYTCLQMSWVILGTAVLLCHEGAPIDLNLREKNTLNFLLVKYGWHILFSS